VDFFFYAVGKAKMSAQKMGFMRDNVKDKSAQNLDCAVKHKEKAVKLLKLEADPWSMSRLLVAVCLLVAAGAACVKFYQTHATSAGLHPSEASGDFYAILGASKSSSDAELKKRYRKLALRWHPDKATPSQRDQHARAFEGGSFY
jgi:preprotein translocase subunit Sec63